MSRFFFAHLAGCLAASAACAAFAAPPMAAVEIPSDRLIVRLKGSAPGLTRSQSDREAIAARLTSRGGELMQPHRVMGDGAQVMQLFRALPPAAIEQLARRLGDDPDVAEILPDRIFLPALIPNETLYPQQWALGAASGVNAPAAWDVTTGSHNLIVGIIDTGRLPHNELVSRWIGGYDFVSLAARENDGVAGRDSDPTDPGDWVTIADNASGPLAGCPVTDSRWHGTAMAGVIGAAGNNFAGIAGLNWNSKLLPVRVVGRCGGYESDIADGMRWAVGVAVPGAPANVNVADLLNVSLSAPGSCSTTLQSAINEVVATGAPVIVAAGNNSLNAASYAPGNCANVITVGAVDRNGGKPAYANFGSAIAVSAPGGVGNTAAEAVLTTFNLGTTTADSNYNIIAPTSGTSIATAQVTGIASLMLSVNPSLLPEQVRDILQNTSRTFPTNTPTLGSQADCTTALCGRGIANAGAALGVAAMWGLAAPRVFAGTTYSGGIRSDGTVFAWGNNGSGRLGVGPEGGAYSLPQHVPGLTGILRIAAGANFAAALRADGTVWSWGSNFTGTLGDGSTVSRGIAGIVPGLSGVTAIAAGFGHLLALKSDGTVWAMGDNGSGQLGLAGFANQSAPVQVAGLTGVTAIAAGHYYSLALKSDNTVWAWGANDYGQLGNGTLVASSTPVQVSGITTATAIAGGVYHSMALLSDGTVRAWGRNATGSLGDTTTVDRTSPVPVSGLAGVTAIAASWHSLALLGDGTLRAWGQNDQGQLGNGSSISSSSPVTVTGMSGVTSIAVAPYHSIALKGDGTAWTWGFNNAGQLGDGTRTNQASRVQVQGIGGAGALNLNLAVATFPSVTSASPGSQQLSNTITVTGIANGTPISITGGEYRMDSGAFLADPDVINAGQKVTLRVTASATCNATVTATLSIAGLAPQSFSVTSAPCNVTDQAAFRPQADLGRNVSVTSNTIRLVEIGFTASISISGGTYSIGCNGTFVSGSGSVSPGSSVCVRQTTSASFDTLTTARLTVGSRAYEFHAMTAAGAGFSTTPMIAVGEFASAALRSDGRVFTWGNNGQGRLGIGSVGGVYPAPQVVPGLSGITSIAAGASHMLAVRSDGTVWAWGANDSGQLGDETFVARDAPVKVQGGVNFISIAEVAAGANHSLARRVDGSVWTWGSNGAGQLGDGTQLSWSIPKEINFSASAIAAGREFSLAIEIGSTGTVWTWGWNRHGQLGNNSTTLSKTPVLVQGLSGVTRIAAGDQHALALRNDNTVWGWGYNYFGQLGDGSSVDRLLPVAAQGMAGAIGIGAGADHSFAVLSDRTVRAWGRNNQGQLGDGGITNRFTPVVVSGLSSAVSVAGGGAHSMALRGDGSVRAWGDNVDGQLGAWFVPGQSVPIAPMGAFGTPTLDLDLAAEAFTNVTNAPLASQQSSNAVAYTGISAGSPISISGGEYRIDNGAFTTLPGTINPFQVVTLRVNTSTSCNTSTSATVTVAGTPKTFTATTMPCDTTADPFSFTPQSGVAPDSVRVSNTVTVTGINTLATVDVLSGEYSIGCDGNFTAAQGLIANGQTLCVRGTAAASYGGSVRSVFVYIGGFQMASFTITTAVSPGFAATPKVSTGYTASYGLRSDGIVFSWGSNSDGQLGMGVQGVLKAVTPQIVIGLANVTMIAAGGSHGLALLSDGIVKSWGRNAEGQAGWGTASALGKYSPGYVGSSPIMNVTMIAAGRFHSLARKNDGTVWAWGDNTEGQLGTGNTTQQANPVQVPTLTNVNTIVAGRDNSFAIKGDGTVWAWGNDLYGQLGDGGSSNPRLSPVAISALNGVSAIATAGNHTLALKGDGTVLAVGWNSSGQLGDGTTTQRLAPITIPGLANVIAVAAGDNFSLALKDDHTVWAWGDGFYGQLGIGTTSGRSVPTQVPGLTGVVAIAAAGARVTVLKDDGSVWSWGRSLYSVIGPDDPLPVLTPPAQVEDDFLRLSGSDTRPFPFYFIAAVGATPSTVMTSNTITVSGLGAGVTSPIQISGGSYSINGAAYTSAPASVSNGSTVVVRMTSLASFSSTNSATVNIGGASGQTATFLVRTRRDPAAARVVPQASAGDSHTLVLASDGTLYATGYNGNGQLGNGTTLGLSFLRPVSGLSTATDIVAGAFHSLALRGDKTVAAWGSNSAGQLGNGSANPFEVNYVDVPGLGSIEGIAAGNYHSVAMTQGGAVYAWGLNAEGQVGDGTSATFRSTPIPVSGLATGVVMIAAGGRHTLALLADGTVRAWGANESGQLGDNSTTQRNAPVSVSGLSGVIAIAAGAAHSLALKNDGTVVAWGFNAFGQLGLGDTTTRLTPVGVSALGNNVGLIAAGANHSLAVKAGGLPFAWGSNANSQLGNGNNANQLTPVALATPALVVAVAGGARHSAAITSERRLHVWGDNFFGQVGNRSGNYNPHSASLNVLRGDSVISEDAGPSGGGVGTGSNSGSSVLEIDGQATAFDFGPISANASRSVSGKYKNASSAVAISNLSLSVTGTSFQLADTDCPSTLAAGAECSFLLGFNPGVAAAYSGELAVSSNLVGSPERRTLNGVGVAPATPAISFQKTGFDFAPQTVGTPTSPVAYVLTNTGNATLAVSFVSSTLTDFSASHSCASVTPGASCALQIVFDPKATGTRVAYLTITSNAAGTPHAVTVSGTGVATVLPPLALVSVKSRRTHNGSAFDFALDTGQPISGAITVESRAGSTQQVIFTFNNPVTATGTASAKDAANNDVGSVSAAANGSEVVVTLSGVPEAQRLSVSLAGVNGTGLAASTAIGFLAGDVDGTRSVTASDILRVKGRAGQPIASTFVHDVDVSGSIDATDVAAVKARSGKSL